MKKNIRIVRLFVASLLIACFQVKAQSQTCVGSTIVSTPDSDFTDNNNGTVTHNVTGLTWMRCSQGQSWNGTNCIGVASKMDWRSALQMAESVNFADKNDWRLPNIKELASIVELSCAYPSINLNLFPSTPSDWFWSSSVNSLYSDMAWDVDFEIGGSLVSGKVDGESGHRHVRLVRGGM